MSWFTSNGEVDDVLTNWINRKFVSDLMWDLQFQKFTTKAIIPEGGGSAGIYVTFSQPILTTGYALGSAALTQGNTGTEHEITSITTAGATCTPAEYGEWYRLGNLMSYSAARGTAEKIQKRMNDGAALALDSATRGDALNSTSYVYATLAVPGATTTAPATVGNLGAQAIVSCNKILKAAYVPKFKGIEGHPDGHYAAILTPTQELQIVTEVSSTKVTWKDMSIYVAGSMGQAKVINGYIGSIYGVACYITQDYTTTTLTSAVEIGYVIGDGGMGAMAFGDMDPQILFNEINSPYKNVKSIAWYAMYDSVLIAAARVLKLYSLTVAV